VIWLFIVLAAYFLISINLTLDKVILKNSLPHPAVYCFYMGILSIFGLVFAPFGVIDFNAKEVVTGILVGAFFLLPLYFMYKAVFENEATRVGPLIGAVTPIFVWLFSFLFLGERFTPGGIIVFLLLVAGGFLISVDLNGEERNLKRKKVISMLKIAVLAAFMFGIYYALLKYVYEEDTFVSGFVWTRLGSFLAAFVFLLSAKNRRLIFGESKTLKPKTGVLVAANKTLSGIAFALLNYAIAIGSVTLVNAMQGLQYVFLLIMVAILSYKYPHILTEAVSRKSLTQKIIAVTLIGLGLAMIAL
jgi:drug/metabolite transporter (DMT)-like permease